MFLLGNPAEMESLKESLVQRSEEKENEIPNCGEKLLYKSKYIFHDLPKPNTFESVLI